MTKVRTRSTSGFTFLELMVVIVILGVLAALISGNFVTSLKKGRDARRKSDLTQIQNTLELYYEDKKAYPTPMNTVPYLPLGESFCETNPCGSTKVYMQRMPSDPTGGNTYFYESDGTYYRIYACMENNLDKGPGVDQNGYQDNGGSDTSCGDCGICKYKVTSSNTQ